MQPTSTPGELKLNWQNNSSNITFFNLDIFNATAGQYNDVINGYTNTYTLSNLRQKEPYYIKIQAGNSDCTTPWSSESVATTAYVLPPDNIYDFAPQPGEIYVAWTGDASVQYKVSRSVNGGSFTDVITLPAGSVSFSEKNLSAYTNYTYKITAVKNGVPSGSQQFTFTTANLSLCSSTPVVKLQNTSTLPSSVYATQTIKTGNSVDATRTAGKVDVTLNTYTVMQAGEVISFQTGTLIQSTPTGSLVADIKDCNTGLALKSDAVVTASPQPFVTQAENRETSVPVALDSASVEVYPNPANGAFTVVVTLPAAQQITLLMKNLQGKTVFVRSLSVVSSFSERVSLVGVSPGLYIISLRSGENSTSKSVLVTR